ncbi:unnamed protein product [Arctia plantaginis]|uniref:Uncharacterized protein n=1 Tax=Arctia plantaginis TaxID=874455 RepID=A0A8S1BH77_ARCPL|nr:unnamed protein product [Arctia plantaginis]
MGSLPRMSVVNGPRRVVPTAPLTKHLEQIQESSNTALVYEDENITYSISYKQLGLRTNALARAISSRVECGGTNRDGDYVIAVCMQPTHETIMTLLATWKVGAAYVPMEPSFPQARICHILNDAEPALIVFDETANPTMFSECGVPAVSFHELADEASKLSNEPLKDEVLSMARTDSIAILLYTSGSTGVPKGVRLSYSAICNRLWWQFHTFAYSDTESTCVWKTALTFVDSVCEIWGPLLHGRTLLILSRETTRDPQKLVKVLSENKIQRLVLVPTLLRSILMYLSLKPSEKPLQSLKLWVCSGEILSKELASQFFKYFGDDSGFILANFYGSTEVMGDVTFHVLERKSQLDNHSTVPIGAPLDNCAVYLLDEEMCPVRESEPGEVWVAGCNLATGYVGGQGTDKFIDNPHASHPDYARLYRTGDFGVLQKGVILFAGRTDSQIKIRGHRVDLHEVDRAVNSIEGVDKSVVLPYGQDSGNPEILAFVTTRPEARISAHHIENKLKNLLTHYMIPQVIEIDTIPLLVNGKVDRQALLKMYENTNNNDDSEIPLDLDYSGVRPKDMEAATVLFETVGEVLGRSARGAISLSSGFYGLGGNSLNSIYTITRLRDKGYYIDISDFLGASNLGEVLSHMSTNHQSTNGSGDKEPRFVPEPLTDEHKDKVIEMIVSSFYNKAELEQFLKHEIEITDYAGLISEIWTSLLDTKLSIVLKDASDSAVAVALNFDARDEPDVDMSRAGTGLTKIMTFLEFVEGSVRDSMLPPGKGSILHSFMMATAEHLSAQENVAAIQALENATMNVAIERGFKGVFTTNTSPLTQQLGTYVLGYQTLLDYQINQYVDDSGERIFGKAPDDMRAVVCWKTSEAGTSEANSLVERISEDKTVEAKTTGTRTIETVVSDPEEAYTIVSSSVDKKVIYDIAKPWLGNGLFTASGMTWRAHRKIMNLAFTQQIMNGLIPVFNTQARCLRDRFDMQEKTFDPEPLLSKNNLETICKTSLGLNTNERQDLITEYGKSIRDIFVTMYERFMKFWLYSDFIFYFSIVKKKQDTIIKGLHKLSTAILEKRKMEIKKMKQDLEPQDQFRPLLDTVLELSIKKGLLTEKEMREELDTIIFAGHETLAMTLSFLLVLLGSDQPRQEKVYQEILDVMGDNDRDVEKEDISKFTYIDCVIKETLRLYPIGPAIPRVATKDIKLKNYVFRAGSSCVIDVWSIHRHPLWGPDPDDFRPERWQDPDKLLIFQKSFAGFGVGNRTCIGKVYAMISLKITLVHLLRKFKVTADVNKMTLKMDSLLRPESGHEITFERRK